MPVRRVFEGGGRHEGPARQSVRHCNFVFIIEPPIHTLFWSLAHARTNNRAGGRAGWLADWMTGYYAVCLPACLPASLTAWPWSIIEIKGAQAQPKFILGVANLGTTLQPYMGCKRCTIAHHVPEYFLVARMHIKLLLI
jgi:hypothetical protein